MKLTLIEYGNGIEIADRIRPLIDRANKVIRQSLGLKRNALIIFDGKLRAHGIAGKIRLDKNLELEIVPKLLDDGDNDWKESLFLLAALSKYGNIVTSEHIHSSTAYKDSLFDIAGRILAREYSAHRRKPIRQYRRERFTDFSIEGEIIFDCLFERNPDGVPQERVSFDRINPFNGTIQSAMRIVLPFVKETSIRETLSRSIQELGPQFPLSQKRLSVPARNREWTDVYNLSFDIVNGMGSSLETGEIMSPSFIVDTWRIWEWLITIALRIGLKNKFQVVPQGAIPWGLKKADGKSTKINVFPDVAMYSLSDTTTPAFLVDAKYKVLPIGTDIDRADLYEAFAFCHATGAKRLFLAYPEITNRIIGSGEMIHIMDYEIGDVTITAVKVAFGSITKQGDLTEFCRRMSEALCDNGFLRAESI